MTYRTTLFRLGLRNLIDSQQVKLGSARLIRHIAWIKGASLILVLCGLIPLAGWAAPPSAPYELALIEFQAGRLQTAIATLHSALRENPQNSALHLLLAQCYYELRDWDGARAHAQAAVSLDPASSKGHQWLGRIYGRQAEQAHSVSLAVKTRKEFEKAVALAPDNVGAHRDLMEFYLQAPWVVGGSKEKARKQANAIAALDPVEGALARARLDASDGDDAQADAEYRQVIAEKPTRIGPWLEAAAFYLQHNDASGAQQAVSAAAGMNPGDPRLVYYRGAVGVLQGSTEAEAELKSYAMNTPSGPDSPTRASALDWLGRLYERQGKTQLAAQQYETALQLDPNLKEAREALERIK